LRKKITGLQTTASRGNVFAALMHLFGPDASKRTNPLVYLFTDCQASGWREVKNQGLEGLIPTRRRSSSSTSAPPTTWPTAP